VLQEYLMPGTVDEALTALKKYENNAYIIAGGTDVMVNLQEKKISPNVLVDVSGIPELKELRLDGEVIRIGAGVTHSQVAKNALIQEKAGVLAMASREVGSLQIRNVATLVGNVVSAQPAADAAIALVALDAVAEIIGVDGKKEMSVLDLYAGVGVCNVDCTLELVTALKFPALKRNQGSAFVRLAKRKALALPMLNVAVVVSLDGGNFEWARIIMAPVGPGPVRAVDCENALKGAPVNSETISRAAVLATNQAVPRDSALRGSAEYRREVIKVLVRRALEQAVASVSNS